MKILSNKAVENANRAYSARTRAIASLLEVIDILLLKQLNGTKMTQKSIDEAFVLLDTSQRNEKDISETLL